MAPLVTNGGNEREPLLFLILPPGVQTCDVEMTSINNEVGLVSAVIRINRVRTSSVIVNGRILHGVSEADTLLVASSSIFSKKHDTNQTTLRRAAADFLTRDERFWIFFPHPPHPPHQSINHSFIHSLTLSTTTNNEHSLIIIDSFIQVSDSQE